VAHRGTLGFQDRGDAEGASDHHGEIQMEVHAYPWGAHGVQHGGGGMEYGSLVMGAHSFAEAGAEVDGCSNRSSRSSQRTEEEAQNLEAC